MNKLNIFNNEIVKKFLSFSLGTWVSIVIGIISTPVITRMVSPEVLGKYSFFISIITFLSYFCILGLDQGFIRFFYEETIETRNKLLIKLIGISLGMALFIYPICFVYNDKISKIIFGISNIKYTWIIVSLGITLKILQRYFLIGLRMNEQGNKYSLLQVMEKILTFVLIVLFVKIFINSGEVLSVSLLSTLIVVDFLGFIFFIKDYKINKVRIKTNFFEVIGYSYPLFFSALSTLLFEFSDRMMLRKFATFEEIGIYAGAFRISGMFQILQTSFSMYWTPLSYKKYNENKDNRVFFKKIFAGYSLIIYFVVIVSMMFRRFIVLFLGNEYKMVINVIPMLMFMILYSISETTYLGLAFSKKSKIVLKISSIVAVANIVGNFLLIPLIGVRGAGISTGTSYLFFLYLRTYYGQKYFNFGIVKWTKLHFVLILYVYLLFQTFTNNFIIDIILGFVLIVILIYFYRDELKKYNLFLRRKDDKRNFE